jgi:serine/threonine protein phosphatase 1
MQNRFLQLDTNPTNGRDFVIGDIHGRYTHLMEGLERVGFNFDTDRLFAVGDLIDRGHENMECLYLIDEPWFYTVVGNHELMMAEGFTNRGQYNMWINNGGHWSFTLDSEDKYLLEYHYKTIIMEQLPFGIEFIAENGKCVGITHTDTPRQWPWWEVVKHLEELHSDALSVGDVIVNHMLWSRTKIGNPDFNKDVYGVDLLVHGHTPSKTPVWRGNAVYIDQGAYNPDQLVPHNVLDLMEEYERRIKTTNDTVEK